MPKTIITEFGYEIRENKNGLQFVVLSSKGLKKIAEKYKEKYDIKIEIICGNEEECKEKFEAMLRSYLDKMGTEEAVGFVMLETNFKGVKHGGPLILIKNNEEKFILIDFESILCNTKLQLKLKNEGFKITFALDYNTAQRDNASCTIFSINTLKHYLIDQEFIKQLARTNFKEIKPINFEKTFLSQRTNFINTISEEKYEKYVQEFDGKDFNLKSFYKGHDYARWFNEEHISLLNKSTKNVIDDIDLNREIFRNTLEYPDAKPLKHGANRNCSIL